MTESLDLDRARDLNGRGRYLWLRRVLLCALAVVPVLALLNVFGQDSSNATATSPTASITVHSPERVRGGLLYEARFTIKAIQDIKQLTLVLSDGWAQGLTINTIEPSPSNETSDNGALSFQLGELKAGGVFVLHMEFQVNPTTVGSRKQEVEVDDGNAPVVSLTRNFAVLP